MKLDQIVPFGRNYDEYLAMFKLSGQDLAGSILGVGDGPASFNAQMWQQGRRVISVDPVYQFSAQEIELRFNQVVDDIIQQVKASMDDWVWRFHTGPESLRATRRRALLDFLDDYQQGKRQGRYICGSLPDLGMDDKKFDLALCSHLLFLYSQHLDLDFHWQSICNMLNIAKEIRIFPLLDLDRRISPHLSPLLVYLREKGYRAHIETVGYELQKGGNQMLRIHA